MAPSTRRSLRSKRTSPSNSTEDVDASNPKDLSQTTQDSNARPVSSGSDGDNGKKKTRSVTFSLEKQSPPSPSASDASSSLHVSARAARSARRQAKIETDPIKKVPSIEPPKNKLQKRRFDMKSVKRNGSSNASSMKKGAGGKDDEVVKVKLITGTLYLYKGRHRRAVFVRRV
mmetsp:Transcript_12715/g.23837  ORF Transcript_12715/g.23837 Transcript_12715/m.23837 type:complete len:173 (+) Transcript_12715:90-608(+)|eukprot:CAMPEP_0176498008 /NCGR_PEP_ID=MMETSP0200_2-20121128/12060_1 /TAXON_ID=947934 /ORGANISM="Chaetoceros sp., Strain GSL56" /LENGTH=172 /DNA_ID=CAMNT_0017896123 /DNA_START=69 /DNA_END=587 /DNA_ORIENTATION=-